MVESFERVCATFIEFTRDEMREFEKKFLSFDVNRNGYIDFFELKQAQVEDLETLFYKKMKKKNNH
jgi:Ca2+-binding EF-hand superfamily protein